MSKKPYQYSYLATYFYQRRIQRRKKLFLAVIFVLLFFTGVSIFKIFSSLPLTQKQETSLTLPTTEALREELVKPPALVAREEEEEFPLQTLTLSEQEEAEELVAEPVITEKEEVIIEGSLQAGETIYESLVNQGVAPSEILNLQEKVKSIVDFNHLPIGIEYVLKYQPEKGVTQFIYKPNPVDVYYIDIPSSDAEDLKVTKEKVDIEIVRFEGKIKNSLYESMIECANSPQLALQMAEIFAWQIDFLTECQEGDVFKILVEKQYRGEFYRWGRILAAQYEGELLSKHTAIFFEDLSGHSDYYTEEGKSLRKAFLRAPLNYKYISSNFTQNRFHPILRTWRPHLAIDYAAPAGTPVSAIGDGTVIFKGWNDGYGNYVEIRHPNNYVTGYGHLSSFAKNLKKGQKVQQGQVIGYVGATGLATGPHLDFSISKDGVKVDFLKLDFPAASSVNAQYRSQFEKVKNQLLEILEGKEEIKREEDLRFFRD